MAHELTGAISSAAGSLAGKVAIITGAAGGIGRAIAKLFSYEGARLVLTDADEGLVIAMAASLPEGMATGLRLDVGKEADWSRAIGISKMLFGRIDILVNSAGVFRMEPIHETSLETYMHTVSINQVGVFLGIRAVIEPMTDVGGGAIVNIASVSGLTGRANQICYGATKWAVRGMTKVAAAELASRGIRVNAVLPGIVRTPMIEVHTAASQNAYVSRLPIARMGEPDEVGQAVLYLASDCSKYSTGAEITVDGGFSVRL